jgi:D-lactate dehydrogenase
MKLAFFDTHNFDRRAFNLANENFGHEISYFEPRLTKDTAKLANGFDAVCAFVNDKVDADAIKILKDGGVKLIALRSAGFNQVDLQAAQDSEIPVVRVPEYSPYAVAEHTVGLILTMNRRIHRAYHRVRDLNFSLDGLVGFDLHGKTVGIIGTGRIGRAFASIMRGFGCEVLAYDPMQDDAFAAKLGVKYVALDELLTKSDIVSLHVPLTPKTKHMMDSDAFSKMKSGVVIVNTSRGGLIDTAALIQALKAGAVGFAALDVYEEEEGVFFQDLSESGLHDDVLARLLTFPNVLVTSHQAFLTHEALANIAETTLSNISSFEKDGELPNQVLLS